MKAVVFAYHDMGLTGLEALQRAGFEIAALFSHEDDPGENCWFGSVRAWALKNGIPLFCPEEVNTGDWCRKIADWRPEVIFSFYYRHLLSREILAIPSLGAFNLHGSLLPHYRGRCPVNWVLVKGESETGVTLHCMTEQADAGDIVAQQAVPIAFADTARSLYGKLCRQAAIMLDEVLPLIAAGRVPRRPQDLAAGSYYGGRRPADGLIDWRWPSLRIYNLIRAVTEPYPGAFTLDASGDRIIIWWALPEDAGGACPGLDPGSCSGPAGRIIVDEGNVFVCAGEGRLRLLEIEINGERLKEGAISDYFREREGEIWQ